MAQRRKGWVEPISYFRRPLPDNADLNYPDYYLAMTYDIGPHVRGAIVNLLNTDAWEGDREYVVKFLEELERLVYETWTCTGGGFHRVEFRLNEGHLEWQEVDGCSALPTMEVRADGHLWWGQPESEDLMTWYDLGNVVGPQGPQGQQGQQGDDGSDGPQGPRGYWFIPTVYEDNDQTRDDGMHPVFLSFERNDHGQYFNFGEIDLRGLNGATGADGGIWQPDIVRGDTPREDGQYPAYLRFTPFPSGTPIIFDEVDLLGTEGPPGDTGPAGDRGWTPIVQPVEQSNGEVHIYLHWEEQDPPYDIDDPSTYVHYYTNIRGARGVEGIPGADGGLPPVPSTTRCNVYYFAAQKIFSMYREAAIETYQNVAHQWAFIQDISGDFAEIPMIWIARIAELSSQLTSDLVNYMQTESYEEYAVAWLFCFLVDSPNFSQARAAQGLLEWEPRFGLGDFLNKTTSTDDPVNLMFLRDWFAEQSQFITTLRKLTHASQFYEVDVPASITCCSPAVPWGRLLDFTQDDWDFVLLNAGVGEHTSEGWVTTCGNAPWWGSGKVLAITRTLPRSGIFSQVDLVVEYNPGNDAFLDVYLNDQRIFHYRGSSFNFPPNEPYPLHIPIVQGSDGQWPVAQIITIQASVEVGCNSAFASEFKVISLSVGGPDLDPFLGG